MIKGVIFLTWGIIFLLVSDRVSSEMRAKVGIHVLLQKSLSSFGVPAKCSEYPRCMLDWLRLHTPLLFSSEK